jgi:hypothetical protein
MDRRIPRATQATRTDEPHPALRALAALLGRQAAREALAGIARSAPMEDRDEDPTDAPHP